MQPPSGVFAATNLVGQGTNTLLKWGTIGGETNVVPAARRTPRPGTIAYASCSKN